MNTPSPSTPENDVSRRRFLKGTATAAVSAGFFTGEAKQAIGTETAARKNPVTEENAKPGAFDWQLTRVRPDRSQGYRSALIEGYASKQSVKSGEAIDLCVSTQPAARFKIEVFRTGYYGGRGARLMTEIGPFQGNEQPVPVPAPETRLVECAWEKTTTLTIPKDWISGVYLCRLTTLPEGENQPYWQNYIVFIVTDDRPADILFQCSDNTWQAYNKWPLNTSLYTHPKDIQGPWAHVSFDRPYARYGQIYDNPQSYGSGEWLCFEYPMAYWLEQHGYDVTYCSNSDLITPERGLKCKAFLSVGHDEYWDIRQYESVTKMKNEGVNLLFLSGNSVCWVTPFSPSAAGVPNRKIFRGGPYGGEHSHAVERHATSGPYPHRGPDEGYLMGARNVRPVNGGGDWTCVNPGHWVFEGTGMKKGDSIRGMIGWEYHGDPPEDLPGLELLATGTAWQNGEVPQQWTATLHSGPKGNFVFNAATIWWALGMSTPPGTMPVWSHFSRPHGTDERVQRITRNLIEKALASY